MALVSGYKVRLPRAKCAGMKACRQSGTRRPSLKSAKRRRAQPDVDDDIEHRTADDAQQLVLRQGRDLEMRAANGAGPPGKRVVVLHEVDGNSGFCQASPAIGLAEYP